MAPGVYTAVLPHTAQGMPREDDSDVAAIPAVVMIGAINKKRGATIRLVSRIRIPCSVPPFNRTMIPRINVMRRTGAAITHVAKPMTGIIDDRHISPIISQLAMTSLLGLSMLFRAVLSGVAILFCG